jgi:ketosteroid isomerase-like protein
MASEVEEFLSVMLPRQLAAEHALCRGDAGPRTGTWSRHDPVTLFGAGAAVRRGWAEVGETSRSLAERFSELRDYRFELLGAGVSGELAYTIAFEHKTVVADGVPATYTLRVTHVYRREHDRWMIAHRHGDHIAPAELALASSRAAEAGAQPADVTEGPS